MTCPITRVRVLSRSKQVCLHMCTSTPQTLECDITAHGCCFHPHPLLPHMSSPPHTRQAVGFTPLLLCGQPVGVSAPLHT